MGGPGCPHTVMKYKPAGEMSPGRLLRDIRFRRRDRKGPRGLSPRKSNDLMMMMVVVVGS
jgi:hypothetical protein